MILICLGYWDGDRDLAFELTDQIGKLLPDKSDLVALMYVVRHDAQPPPEAILNRDRQKFHHVYAEKTFYKATGWPAGCNAIAYSVLNRILPKAHRDVEAALILESDCVITRQEWDKELWAEWQKARSMGKDVCGTVLPWGWKGCGNHVNASAIWGRKAAAKIPGIHVGKPMGKIAWDYYYGRVTTPLCYNSKLFKLDYKRATIGYEELCEQECLILHGIKDSSARDGIRRKFNL